METYQEMERRHQQEVNQFPFMFAFSNEQFDAGMRKLGLHPNQTDQISSIGGGGFIRKSDSKAMHEMFARHKQEREAAIAADQDGTGYAYRMFLYQLGNHEYCITQDLEETLEACNLTVDEVNGNPNLLKALARAIHDYMKHAVA